MLSLLFVVIAAACPDPQTRNVAFGAESCLSFGAVMRERYEYLGHPEFGALPTDSNGYLLHQLLAHAELRWREDLRAFVELGAAGVYGAKHRERPGDRDWLDLHQAYLDIALETVALTLRGGRQEVSYGSSRLISVREGTNVRHRFDGVRATLHPGPVQTEVIVLRPVETDHGVFDDAPERGQWLWGAYGTAVLSSTISFDLYYLGLRRPDAEFAQGTELELRHSIGARIFGVARGFDYNFELVYQLGSFGRGHISAWMVASDTGFTLERLAMRPRFGLRANITSGDRDPNDPDLQTFNPLFPTGVYFSEASLLGPLNHFDLQPTLAVRLATKLAATVEWDFFWRQSRADTVYRISTLPIVRGASSRARYVGTQAALRLEWEIDPQLAWLATYVHFFAGSFSSGSAVWKDVDFIASWLVFRI